MTGGAFAQARSLQFLRALLMTIDARAVHRLVVTGGIRQVYIAVSIIVHQHVCFMALQTGDGIIGGLGIRV